jgi:hypothetical protein
LFAPLNTDLGSRYGAFTVSANTNLNNLTISCTLNIEFNILTDSDLITQFGGNWNPKSSAITGAIEYPYYKDELNYDAFNPQSLNDLLRNNIGTSPTYNKNTPFVSDFLNLQQFRNLYLSSPNLGTFSIASTH